MKKQLLLALVGISMIYSCASIQQIGKVNMISNRNIDPKMDYSLISSYSGGSNRELRKSRALSIEDAIDQTVRKVAGGEFLMNVKIYIVNDKYYAVEGDVWGTSNISYRGFKVGDKVIVDNQVATIKSLKDDKTCFIEKRNGAIEEVKYDKLSKVERKDQ